MSVWIRASWLPRVPITIFFICIYFQSIAYISYNGLKYMKKIVIGTRGSQLALIQTDIVKKLLHTCIPDVQIDIQVIHTKGDKDMHPVPLDTIGKGWFTKEIDKALLEGSIDIAIHSLKDLPEILPEGLIIAAIPEREDAREALVTRDNVPFVRLKKGAIIGTDSNRRKVQVLHKRPDLVVKSVRGNVNRRLEKLDNGDYDGLFLAVAGLKRLGLENRITEYFSVADIIPSPGQGALAVVIKKNNISLFSLVTQLNHQQAVTATSAERVFSKKIGGGCKMPVGVYAECFGNTITLHGVLGSLDGEHLIRDSIQGNIHASVTLAQTLATRLLKASKQWSRYIVITRPLAESERIKKQLEDVGLQVFLYPSIAIQRKPLTEETKKYLEDIVSFDWILFTSRNGVRFFMEELAELGVDTAILRTKQIAAVGPKTAEEVKKYQLPVHFIPSEFTTRNLANELQKVEGKKILLPRSNIASASLIKQLQKRGAIVMNVPIYNTGFVIKPNKTFEALLESKKILCITFTSPSTVEGFLKNIGAKVREKVLSLP